MILLLQDVCTTVLALPHSNEHTIYNVLYRTKNAHQITYSLVSAFRQANWLTVYKDVPCGTRLSILILNHTHKCSSVLPKDIGNGQLSCWPCGESAGREWLAILAKPGNCSLRKIETSQTGDGSICSTLAECDWLHFTGHWGTWGCIQCWAMVMLWKYFETIMETKHSVEGNNLVSLFHCRQDHYLIFLDFPSHSWLLLEITLHNHQCASININ